MDYDLPKVVNMLRIYRTLEFEAEKFWFIASFPRKDKAQRTTSAKITLKAIEEYK